MCKKGCYWNLAICRCKNGKYAGSIDDSVVKYSEIIEETIAIPTKSTATKTIPTKSASTNNNKQ